MTQHALVIDNQIQSIGRLPNSARRLDDGAWVVGLADATQALREATGWLEVVDTARPDDTDTATHDYSVELVAGVPTVTWTERDKTPDELAAEDQSETDALIRQQVKDHLSDLRTITGSSGSLTNAQLSNAVRVLARGQIRLIRLAVGLLDGTD